MAKRKWPQGVDTQKTLERVEIEPIGSPFLPPDPTPEGEKWDARRL